MSAARKAKALSDLRLFVSAVIDVLIVITPFSLISLFVYVLLLAIASYTEPIDGRIARKGPLDPKGKWYNERGTMGLSIGLPVALLIHMGIGFWLPAFAVSKGVLLYWLISCAAFLGATLFVFNRAKDVLRPRKAAQYEVVQAWFTALIVVMSEHLLFWQSWIHVYGTGPSTVVWVIFYVLVAFSLGLVIDLSQDRFDERRQELKDNAYKGTRKHLYRRG